MKCDHCGLEGGFHTRGCATWLAEQPPPPPVCDLAEFERQLKAKMALVPISQRSLTNVTYGALLQALEASKWESK